MLKPKDIEFDLYDTTLQIFINKPIRTSPTGFAMRAANSPNLNMLRREKIDNGIKLHILHNNTELTYTITNDDAISMAEFSPGRFEFEPENT